MEKKLKEFDLMIYSKTMNKILEHIESRVKELSIARLRAEMTEERTWKAFLNGQIEVYNELYIMLWKEEQKIVQRANTQQETR